MQISKNTHKQCTKLGFVLVFFTAFYATWAIAVVQIDEVGHPTFLSPHASPVLMSDGRVFVVNTPADTLDVINATTKNVVARVNVGIDPVGLALKPDGKELWVSNHVSDSVSVIDIDPQSMAYLQVIATIQDIDPISKATRMDEPVGIAFANNDKAYVALSSENKIAVVDVANRKPVSKLNITAQDPRAITVQGNRLYVIPFESNNQTQISGCNGPLGSDLCTFNANQHVINSNNVLSRFAVVDIVKHPSVPDRDLYIFDTESDQLVQVVNTLGTLLYGIAVDSKGQVFVAQTDARNDINGKAGTRGDGLAEMENRAFLNQITSLNCSNNSCATPQFIDLEPVPPANPLPNQALATPYAIQISEDDTLLLATAASSNRLFAVDANSGEVLGSVNVGSVPRGVALESDATGKALIAWVFNAVSNTMSRVDVSNPADMHVTDTISMDDPTHPQVKRGRMAFNDASASTSGTFSCESCHPDGGTDQLAWVLDTPICNLPGCTQIPPRITMPIRGLRDTAPYHWDGIPGDPYGGTNTANIFSSVPATCFLDDPESCTLDVVNGGLASTMCMAGACPFNDEGKDGSLSAVERDDMAKFLLSIPYPPAQRRAHDNVLSSVAKNGFKLFHIDGDLQGNPTPNVCGDCHRMPFWVSTNTPGTGMEAPTWRGAYDRWLILPQGRLNIIDFLFYKQLTDLGVPEENMWRLSWASRSRFNPVWNMVTEGSTGFSGAFARQVTFNRNGFSFEDEELLNSLETAASKGGIVLQGEGIIVEDVNTNPRPVSLQFDMGQYINGDDVSESFSRAQLTGLATNGEFVGTFTARLGHKVDVENPQPALWSSGPIHFQGGRQAFPTVTAQNKTMTLSGRHVQTGAHIWVDGKRVAGNVRCRQSGELPDCAGESIEIQLLTIPDSGGVHFVQLQNSNGLFSNDFIFHTNVNGVDMTNLDVSGPWFNASQNGHGWILEHRAASTVDDPDLINAYWYVYQNGQPVWLVGQGELIDGLANIDVFITSGAEFPPDFVAEAVNLTAWGRLTFEFADSQTANVSWDSVVPGFSSGSLNIQKIAAIDDSEAACQSGTYYNPDQNGHGLVAQVLEVAGQTEILLTWYVYVNGQQVWLLGQAPLTNGQAEVAMNTFSGADFPPNFNSSEVVNLPWGVVSLQFNANNRARIDWQTQVEGYKSGAMSLQRLTYLKGHNCQ